MHSYNLMIEIGNSDYRKRQSIYIIGNPSEFNRLNSVSFQFQSNLDLCIESVKIQLLDWFVNYNRLICIINLIIQLFQALMVLLNYESFIAERIIEQSSKMSNYKAKTACKSQSFRELLIKLYEYCQEINIIEHRMKVLAKETQKIKGIKPKLLESQITKVKQKTKQISSAYSIFLFQQEKFKVSSQEANFYESVIKCVVSVLQTCFKTDDFVTLKKEINRLFRTNTFNKKLCWGEFLEEEQANYPMQSKTRKLKQSDFRNFRKKIMSESSQIRPYVHNQTCYRSNMTRSPIISLLHPTKEYLSFKLKQQQSKKLKKAE